MEGNMMIGVGKLNPIALWCQQRPLSECEKGGAIQRERVNGPRRSRVKGSAIKDLRKKGQE